MTENVTIPKEEYLDLLESKLELINFIKNETTSFDDYTEEIEELQKKIDSLVS